MPESFGETLAARIEAFGPLAVGVDPSARVLADWGVSDDADGAAYLGLTVIEAVAPHVPAIKIQVAFFERFGAAGFVALEHVMDAAREASLLVLADAKRGDIGSTNEAYADAWLGDGPLGAHALTVSPYTGVGSLEPFVLRAQRAGRGLFVLAATSNPEGGAIQGARVESGRRVSDAVLEELAARNARSDGRGVLGAVIGATREVPQMDLASLGGPVLVPGVGAQGAGASDVARLTRGCARASVLPSLSRAILARGPSVAGLAAEARHWRDELARELL